MRYVYVDEAGVSANEPISVVVGIILNADQHWNLAAELLREARLAVPEQYREGFIAHATAIWGDRSYRENWSFAARMSFLKTLMAIPLKIGAAISFGICRRTFPMPEEPTKLKPAQLHHLVAFSFCMAKADQYVREYGYDHEVMTVVAEDHPDMKPLLRGIANSLVSDPIILTPEMLRPTHSERQEGVLRQSGEFKMTRLADIIHFARKIDSPLLQIADACAFGLRRFFSDQSYGDEFAEAVLHGRLRREDWSGHASGGIHFSHPRVVRAGTPI